MKGKSTFQTAGPISQDVDVLDVSAEPDLYYIASIDFHILCSSKWNKP